MRLLLILLLSLTLFSCDNSISDNQDQGVNQVPEHLLSQEEFTNMLTDSYFVEAAIRQEVGKGAKGEEMSRYFYPQLFEKYHITEQDFKDNIKYYARNPELMQQIQTDMVNRLAIKEEELTNQSSD